MWPVTVPSAVSSMLERLCPRLMPLTAGARSTLDPLSCGVEDVTSGGTLFSRVKEREMSMKSQPTHLVNLELVISKDYLCVCVPVHLPRGKQQVEAGAVVGFWALHGRGWRKQTRRWRSFGRNGWSSNLGSAGSELVLHWEQLFYAVSPHPLMQKTCLLE